MQLGRQRRPLSSGAYALRAAIADAVECSGCVTATALGFNYAGSATKGGAATDVACTACVSVSELKFDGDVDLGGNSLKGANATFTGDVAAKTVTATSFAGDGSKLTGISQPKGACKAGEAVVGIAADGALQCQAFSAALPADGLDEVSNGLLTTQFTETVALGAAIGIPDNTGASANVKVDVPDWGVAQGLTIKVKVSNTDLSTLSLKLLPPDDKKVGITLCDPCGAKDAKALDTAWSDKVAPKFGDLAAWVGGNAKGSWNLVALDTGFCLKQAPGNGALCDLDNKIDGAIEGFTIEVATLSTQKVATNGLLIAGKNVDFQGSQALQMRLQNSATDPLPCTTKTIGLLYYNTTQSALMVCNGTKFKVFATVAPLGSAETPAKDCAAILAAGADEGSGAYWLAWGNEVAQAYCDMTANDAGWTLATSWAYGPKDGDWGKFSTKTADPKPGTAHVLPFLDLVPAPKSVRFIWLPTGQKLQWDIKAGATWQTSSNGGARIQVSDGNYLIFDTQGCNSGFGICVVNGNYSDGFSCDGNSSQVNGVGLLNACTADEFCSCSVHGWKGSAGGCTPTQCAPTGQLAVYLR